MDKKNDNIYLAGPWFSEKQKAMHIAFYGEIEKPNTFNPRLHLNDGSSPRQAFEMDVMQILKSREVHALLCQNDTGTAWEMGFAYANNIPVYLLVESVEELKKTKTNIMMAYCITGVVTLQMYASFKDGDKLSAKELRDGVFNDEWIGVE